MLSTRTSKKHKPNPSLLTTTSRTYLPIHLRKDVVVAYAKLLEDGNKHPWNVITQNLNTHYNMGLSPMHVKNQTRSYLVCYMGAI